MTVRGRIIEVTSYKIGGYSEADYAAAYVGAIEISSASDFNDEGGFCVINGNTYPYSTITPGPGSDLITITTPLSDALEEGSPVYVAPLGERKMATIATLDAAVGDPSESIECVVNHSLSLTLEEGRREEGFGEEVIVDTIMGVPTVIEIKDRVPRVPSTAIDGLDQPTEAPDDAPIITVTPSGIAGIQVEWPAVENAEKYEIHLSLTSPVDEDGSQKVAETVNTVWRVYDEIDGLTIPMGSTVYVKVRAVNNIDVGPFSLEGSATTRTADGFITAAFVAAIRAEFNDLVAGTIEAALANVTGVLNIGPRMQFDGENSSFTTWADNEHTQIIAQISPLDAIFRGRVETDFLNTMRGIVLTGIDSQISSGGMLYLMSGVGDPGSPPNLSVQPLTTPWTPQPLGFLERGVAWSTTESRFYRLLVPDSGDISGKCRVQRVSAAGVASAYVELDNVSSITETDANGIAVIGTTVYVCFRDATGWCVANFDIATGAYLGRTGRDAALGRPAVGRNSAGDRVLFARTIADGSSEVIKAEQFSTDLSTSYGYLDGDSMTDKLLWDPTWSNNLSYIGISSFDLGANHLMIFSGATGRFYDHTGGTVYNYDNTKDFNSLASVSVGGSGWIPGGVFYATYGGTYASQFNAFQVNPANPRAYVTFSFTNGADHTLDSPPANMALANRKYLYVTLPGLPDDVTSWDVFMGISSSLPADSALWNRLETITDGSMVIDPSTAPGSSHPPASNTFGASTPAEIRSQSGDSYWRGDDSVAFPQLEAIYDSDWIDLVYTSGYNGTSTPGQAAVRRYGRVVRLRGGVGITTGTFGASAVQITADPLPAAMRPESGTRARFTVMCNGFRTAHGEVRDDGHIWVAPEISVTGITWMAIDHTFLAG